MSLNPLVDSRDRMLRPAEQPNPGAYVHIKKNLWDLKFVLTNFHVWLLISLDWRNFQAFFGVIKI